MMTIHKNLKLSNSVSDIKIIEDTIYLLDSSSILYTYDYETLILKNKIILQKDAKSRHIYDTTFSISNDFSIYTSENNKNNGTLFSSKNNKIIKKSQLSYHENSVATSKFSNNANLLAIGDEDGKVFFYDKTIERLLFSYSPRADAISCISFSMDDKYTSVASYDKTLIIYDIEKNKELLSIIISDVLEDSVFLTKHSFFIGITRNNKLFNINLKTNEIFYANFEFTEWPTTIIEIGSRHILIGTRESNLYLVNSQTLELVKEIEVQNIGIKKLVLHNKYLFIGYIDGIIEIVDLDKDLDLFETYLNKNNFTKATQLLEENIFLLVSDTSKKYDLLWEQVLEMAKTSLMKKDQQRALQIVHPFFFDKKKEIEYNRLNANKEIYTRFNDLVDKEQDISAFKLADEYQYLKDTKEFVIIEKKWQKVYSTCKYLFEKDKLESSQKAIDTLKRYTNIASKEEGIKHLITNYKFFIRAQKLVKSRNFKLYFRLTQNKPFLTKEDLYNKVNQLGHNTYLKLLDLEEKKEFEQASNTAKYLQHFTDFQQKATECLSLIETKILLIECIEADDKHTAYNIVEDNYELENFQNFISYHNVYITKKQESLEFAKQGDTHNVYQKLIPYLGINYLVNSIGIIFKLSYISEMEGAKKINIDSIHWSESIKKYLSLFGLDNEISTFIKIYNLSDLVSQDKELIKEKKFKDIEFIDSILVHK